MDYNVHNYLVIQTLTLLRFLPTAKIFAFLLVKMMLCRI